MKSKKWRIAALAFLAVVVVVASFSFAATSFAAEPALETDSDGYYKIESADDLIEFRNNYYDGIKGRLYADIDMSGKEFTPFEKAIFYFDGNGKTISNLSRTYEGDGNIGLFIDTASNGNMVNSNITDINFKNCSLTVKISGTNESKVGIVAGMADRAAVTGCTFDNVTLKVTGSDSVKTYVGMVCGRADWGYDAGKIPVNGVVNSNCSITATGSMTYAAGIVGAHNGDLLEIIGAKVDCTIDAPNKAAYVYQLWSTALIDSCTTTTGLPATNFPDKVTTIYTVNTTDELDDIIAKLNDGTYDRVSTWITLGADLDYTGKTFTPISPAGGGYVGTFEGGGHTIKGIELTYDDVQSGNYGLLINNLSNSNANGKIYNLTLENCSITVNAADGASDVTVGGFAGKQDRGYIENCHLVNVTIEMNGEFSGISSAGGITGHGEWACDGRVGIINCTTDAASSVTTNGSMVCAGGIIGSFKWSDRLDINGCKNYASVSSAYVAGGIVGNMIDANSADNGIYNSVSAGPVNASVAGGFIGNFGGNAVKIENSICTALITGDTTDTFCASASGTCTTDNGNTDSAIFNPLSTDEFAAYVQTATGDITGGKLRVVIVANYAKMIKNSAVNVSIKFELSDGTTKTHSGKFSTGVQDFELFREVSAGSEVFEAADGNVMFGAVYTGVPFSELESVTVTITDGSGTELYKAQA